MKINNLFYSTLILSLLVIGCNNNNPFKNNKNVSQGTGWKISTKDGGFKNKKSYKKYPNNSKKYVKKFLY